MERNTLNFVLAWVKNLLENTRKMTKEEVNSLI
jgi:hypothetical protein